MAVRRETIGKERAPLLVIDDFADHPDDLVRQAVPKHFSPGGRFYPGIRAKAPLTYQRFLTGELRNLVAELFHLGTRDVRLTMCHYSLVTTPPSELVMEQRIPHIDSPDPRGLASIHYLFRGPLGGTAFYRHRETGFEYIDHARKERYFRSLERQLSGPKAPGPGYINGDTPLFEQVASEAGVFNRILVYRRNSLHSGSIGADFVPDPDPRSGRLSINSFIAPAP